MVRYAEIVLILVLLAAASSATVAIELTADNYFTETVGKVVFLKFFAPWCAHCKALQPHWDRLLEAYHGSLSTTVLIAEVDCAGTGEVLCTRFGVKGYPKLKWGDPSDLQDYNGGRFYEEMKKFADENLVPQCNLEKLNLCTDEQKAQIMKYLGMSVEELNAEATKEEERLIAAEEGFQENVRLLRLKYDQLAKERNESENNVVAAEEFFEVEAQKIRDTFDQLESEKNDFIATTKALGLNMLNTVLRSKEAPERKVKIRRIPGLEIEL